MVPHILFQVLVVHTAVAKPKPPKHQSGCRLENVLVDGTPVKGKYIEVKKEKHCAEKCIKNKKCTAYNFWPKHGDCLLQKESLADPEFKDLLTARVEYGTVYVVVKGCHGNLERPADILPPRESDSGSESKSDSSSSSLSSSESEEVFISTTAQPSTDGFTTTGGWQDLSTTGEWQDISTISQQNDDSFSTTQPSVEDSSPTTAFPVEDSSTTAPQQELPSPTTQAPQEDPSTISTGPQEDSSTTAGPIEDLIPATESTTPEAHGDDLTTAETPTEQDAGTTASPQPEDPVPTPKAPQGEAGQGA